MDLQTLKTRIESVLSLHEKIGSADAISLSSQMFSGALTLLSAVYGPDSPQARTLQDVANELRNSKNYNYQHNMSTLIRAVEGALRNLKEELDSGLAGSLQKRLTSEVLTDLVQLARAVLDESGDSAKNVAAVLAAAAYEDTIRRMGASFAGIIGKEDLSNVIDVLKTKGILVAPQLGIAISYLSFRNHALHANWDKIDRTSVNSVLAFVQELLLKHFQ